MPAHGTPYRVLMVCAGNTCRSPMAAQFLAARLDGAAGFEVVSAGIQAEVGSPMTVEASETVKNILGAVAPHSARQLRREHVERADLVLAATGDIRDQITSQMPAARGRVFTILSFARAVAGDDAQLPAYDDIDDPFGRSAAYYRRTGEQVDMAATAIAAALVQSRGNHAQQMWLHSS